MRKSVRHSVRHLAGLIALALLWVAPASAAMLGDASVTYRAIRTVTVNGKSYAGTVIHAPGHERHEQDLMGIHEVFLLDIPAAQGDLVLPSVKTYVVFPFPPLMAELDSPDLTRHPVGHETVAGIETTKYRVDHTAKDGSSAEGFLWVSRDGILAKFDVAVTRAHGGKPMKIEMELSQLSTGMSVDPSLFDLPKGFVALPADALGPLLGGKAG